MKDVTIIPIEDWWKECFDSEELEADKEVYLNLADAQKEIDAVMRRMREDDPSFRPQTALDICCGTGRHVNATQKRVPLALGADYSMDFLRSGVSNGISRSIFRADVRELPMASGMFDLITCMGNSLGYSTDDNDQRIFSEASRVSKRGAYLVFNTTDKRFCLDNLKANARYEYPSGEGTIANEYERRVMDGNTLVVKQITFADERPVKIMDYQIRLYEPEELARLGRNAELESIATLHSSEIHGHQDEGDLGCMASNNFYLFRKS